MTRSFRGTLAVGSAGRGTRGRWSNGRNRLRRTSCPGCWRRPCVEAGEGCAVRSCRPAAAGGTRARAAGQRPADRDRAGAAGEERGAGDRDRRAGVRRGPDLGQHSHRWVRALDRRRADDLAAASGSRCPRRCRGSRSGRRGRSTWRRSNRWATRMAVISERRGPVIGVGLLVWLVVARAWPLLVTRGRVGAGRRFRLVGLSVVYLPLLLLLGAALEPSQGGRTAAGDARGAAACRRSPSPLLARLPGARGRLGARRRSPTRST